MDYSHDLRVNDLLCTENETSLIDYDDDVDFVTGDDEAEFVKILLDRESLSFGFNKNNEILGFDSWIRFSRSDTIDWILKIRDIFGFRCQTAYLCMTYFDKFLMRSVNSGNVWPIRLLSVACLSLAVKMEESKVPSLSKFLLDDTEFESKVILKMELLVFKTLEWKMDLITPFVYLPYFVTTMCNSSPTNSFVSKSSQLILDIMKDINLINYRPSVVAIATVMMAFERRLTRKEMKSKMKGTAFYKYLDIEDIFTCYSLMQDFDTSSGHRAFNSLAFNSSSTPNTSPSQFRPAFYAPENFYAAPALSQKRKRHIQ